MPNQPTHTATIAALLAEIDAQPGYTAADSRMKQVLMILADVVARQEDIAAGTKRMATEIATVVATEVTSRETGDKAMAETMVQMFTPLQNEVAAHNARLAVLEAQMTQTNEKTNIDIDVLVESGRVLHKRLAAVESWREMMTGDGR